MSDVIPEPHAGYARQICELATADRTSLRDQVSAMAGLSDSYATRLVEDPTIICVDGERGSGKTTVLAAAAAQLSAQGHVVIPPIRPEYFVASTLLIPTAVAHLQTTVRSDWTDHMRGLEADASQRIGVALERTLRQANLVVYGRVDSSLLRADEQAADHSLAASADSEFLNNWRELSAQVRYMAAGPGKDAQPLLIIPVDDPDLAPGTLRQILLDLRLLTSIDGVIGVTCLDLEEARSILADAYSNSYSSPPNRLLTARVVQAQIAKAFPDDRRVRIAGLDREHKLSFKALDLPLPTIEELCAGYEIGGEHHSDTLATLFRMPNGEPSLYTTALPFNPRDLRALAYRLSSIPEDCPNPVGEAAMVICSSAVETGLKQSGAIEPSLWPNGLPFGRLDEPVDGRPSCDLRFDDISVHGSGLVTRTLPDSPDKDSAVRVALGYESGIEMRLVKRGDRTETIQRLDPALSYALLLVREFSHHYGVLHENLSGSPPIRGGERSTPHFRVTIDGTSTDHRFLNPPAWEAYYDYFLLDDAQRALIPVAIEDHGFSDRRYVIEAYFIDFCRNVTAIQADRQLAEDPARISRAIREAGEKECPELLEREFTNLFEQFESCLRLERRWEKQRTARAVRASDFRYWVDVSLVNVCHDRLLRPVFIEQLLNKREELLGREHRLRAANADVSSVLERRIKGALDEPWVLPLIELLRRFDAELGGILSASHEAALQTVERSRHRLLGESAVAPMGTKEDLKEPQKGADTDFEIALEVLDRLENEVETRARQRP